MLHPCHISTYLLIFKIVRAISYSNTHCEHIELCYLESHFHHYIPFPVSISMCMLKKCFSLFIDHVSPMSYSYVAIDIPGLLFPIYLFKLGGSRGPPTQLSSRLILDFLLWKKTMQCNSVVRFLGKT